MSQACLEGGPTERAPLPIPPVIAHQKVEKVRGNRNTVLASSGCRCPVTDRALDRVCVVEPTTFGTLLLVVTFVPASVPNRMATRCEELVEDIVGTLCRSHTWYAIPHQYIGLLVSALATTRHNPTDCQDYGLPDPAFPGSRYSPWKDRSEFSDGCLSDLDSASVPLHRERSRSLVLPSTRRSP